MSLIHTGTPFPSSLRRERLNKVELAPAEAFHYAYKPGTDLIESVKYPNPNSPTLRSVRTYNVSGQDASFDPRITEPRLLLSRVTNIRNGSTVSKYVHWYDSLGRVAAVVNSGSAFGGVYRQNQYGYDERNEIVSSYRYSGKDPAAPGGEIGAERRMYAYDPIGNRETASSGNPPATTTYKTNELNQYTDTIGPIEEFSYDEDGNLTADGSATYTYDGENRLLTVVNGDDEVRYIYDYMGRCVHREHLYLDELLTDAKYVYDGWVAVAELDGDENDLFQRAYTWGLDLSGSLEGAGGIGGLLALTLADGTDHGCFYDGNGNVGQLVRLTDSTVVAKYRYDPYGQFITEGDSVNNPFRFSTKPYDPVTGLYYYGYRFYSPRLGRWVARDPWGEPGGIGLYLFGLNRPSGTIDSFGLWTWRQTLDLLGGTAQILAGVGSAATGGGFGLALGVALVVQGIGNIVAALHPANSNVVMEFAVGGMERLGLDPRTGRVVYVASEMVTGSVSLILGAKTCFKIVLSGKRTATMIATPIRSLPRPGGGWQPIVWMKEGSEEVLASLRVLVGGRVVHDAYQLWRTYETMERAIGLPDSPVVPSPVWPGGPEGQWAR